MPPPQTPNPQAPPRDKPNLIDGRLMIAGTAMGCIVLFFIVWGAIRMTEQAVRDARPELIWADRASWFAPSVIQTTLVKPNPANVQYTYNKPRYRDPGLVIHIEEEQAVLACAKLAASPTFADDATRQALLQHIADADAAQQGELRHTRLNENFYAHYLLATWHQLHGDTQAADAQYQRAVTAAPKIIVIQYKDEQGNPVANLKLDSIEIGCDRVTDDGETLDQRLVLIYPQQKTDPAGRVYLPVYNTTYRLAYLPQTPDHHITYSPAEGWFKLPTRLGTLSAKAIINAD